MKNRIPENNFENRYCFIYSYQNLIKPVLLMTAITWCIYFSYHIGYIKGRDKGFYIALDTVNQICAKQLKSDTSVSKLMLINLDTTVYFLSGKTVIGR